MAFGLIPDYGSQASSSPLAGYTAPAPYPVNRPGAGGVVLNPQTIANLLGGLPALPPQLSSFPAGIGAGGSELSASPHSVATGASRVGTVNPGGPMIPYGPAATAPAAGADPGGAYPDPAVLAAQALAQQGIGNIDAQLRAQRERAIINFGDPSLAGEAGFGLDPQAGAFAQQSYLSGNSTLARLDRAHHLASQAIINRLAAHGMLHSGDYGYLEGQENQDYGNTSYDARQSVLDLLSGYLNTYLSQRNQIEQGPINAMQQSLANYLANPDAYASTAGGGGPSRAQAPPQTVEMTRRPVSRAKPAAAKALSRGSGRAAATPA